MQSGCRAWAGVGRLHERGHREGRQAGGRGPALAKAGWSSVWAWQEGQAPSRRWINGNWGGLLRETEAKNPDTRTPVALRAPGMGMTMGAGGCSWRQRRSQTDARRPRAGLASSPAAALGKAPSSVLSFLRARPCIFPSSSQCYTCQPETFVPVGRKSSRTGMFSPPCHSSPGQELPAWPAPTSRLRPRVSCAHRFSTTLESDALSKEGKKDHWRHITHIPWTTCTYFYLVFKSLISLRNTKNSEDRRIHPPGVLFNEGPGRTPPGALGLQGSAAPALWGGSFPRPSPGTAPRTGRRWPGSLRKPHPGLS